MGFYPSARIIAQNIQENKFQIRTGFGYFDPRAAGATGNIFYTDIGYKLPTKFVLSLGFGLSDIFDTYRADGVPLFAGFRKIENYYLFRLSIDRTFELGEKQRHQISVGTGLLYEQLRYAEPQVFLNPNTQELFIGLRESNRNQDEAGLLLFSEYGYKIGHFTLGIRGEIHFLYAYGTTLRGFVLSPQIRANF